MKSLLEEVLDSITHILNTKPTFGAWGKDLGLEDFSGCNEAKERVKNIADSIVLNIKKYEKRLKVIDIKMSKFKGFSDFSFELQGELEGKVLVFDINISKKSGINFLLRQNFTES